MDGRFFRSSCSRSIILLITTLGLSVHGSDTTTSHSNLFLALKLASKTFPGRNCGLARSSRESQTPTCLKLRSSILLTKSTFAASYLIMLAGDISSNPGSLQTVSNRKSKLSFWSFNARNIVNKDKELREFD